MSTHNDHAKAAPSTEKTPAPGAEDVVNDTLQGQSLKKMSFAATPPPLKPSQVMQLQRVLGNQGVQRYLNRHHTMPLIQREMLNASFPQTSSQATSSVSNASTEHNDVSTLSAEAYRRARSLVDAAPTSELPTLRGEIEQAMEQHGNVSGVTFTLQLAGQRIPNFLSDRLNDLHGATDVGSRREFEHARHEAEARRHAAELQAEARRRREATRRYLASLDQPAAVSGHADLYIVHSPQGQDIQVTRAQISRLRVQAAPMIRRLVSQAENSLVAANEVTSYANAVNLSFGPPTRSPEYEQLSNAASDTSTSSIQQLGLGDNGLLERAFLDALSSVETARAADAAALAAAQDTTTVQNIVTALRIVRDTCIGIEGTLITIATAGAAPGIGAVVAGTAFSTVAGTAAAASDQHLEHGHVQWSQLLAGAALSAITGIVGGRLGHAFNTRAAHVLTNLLSTELARQPVSAAARETIVRQVLPTVVNTVVARASAGAAAGANAALTGANNGNIRAAFNDQVSLRAIILEVLTAQVGIRAGNLPRGELLGASSGSGSSSSGGPTSSTPSSGGSTAASAPHQIPAPDSSSAGAYTPASHQLPAPGESSAGPYTPTAMENISTTNTARSSQPVPPANNSEIPAASSNPRSVQAPRASVEVDVDGNVISSHNQGSSQNSMSVAGNRRGSSSTPTSNRIPTEPRHSDTVAPLVSETYIEQGGREIITQTHSNTRSDAWRVVQDIVGELSNEVPKMGKFGTQDNRVVGRMSGDGRRGWRVDYDPRKGAHYNWWNHNSGDNGAVLFDGDQSTVDRVVDLLHNTYGPSLSRDPGPRRSN